MMHFSGVGGTSKSKSIKAICHAFEKEDVAILNTNADGKYGAYELTKGFCVNGSEMGHGRLRLPKGEFLQMVEGTDMSLNIKFVQETSHIMTASQGSLYKDDRNETMCL